MTAFRRVVEGIQMAFAKLRNLGEKEFAALQGELARGKAPLGFSGTDGIFINSADPLRLRSQTYMLLLTFCHQA